MTNDQNSDDAKMAQYGAELVAAVDAAIKPWLQQRSSELLKSEPPEDIINTIDLVAVEAHRLLVELTTADIDQPLSGPLERIRRAVAPLTEALDAAEARRPTRDSFDAEMRPDDVFDLGPMAFTDLSEAVHAAGITWGAAKAYLHQQRHLASEPSNSDPSG